MNATEVANIILRLTQEGWDSAKINEFLAFIGTHNTSEKEIMDALQNSK